MKTLIIIPAYNESQNIESVVKNLKECFPEYSYIIINDCSTDSTVEVCKSNGFDFVNLPCNLGIGGAVQTGYIYAEEHGYDCAIQMDGDGQHDPKYLDKLLKPIEQQEADIVIGSRFIECNGFQSSGMRRFGIRFLSRLIKLSCGITVKDVTSGYRAVNRRFIELFAKEYADDYPEPEAIVSARMSGGRITEVPVEMLQRSSGVSSISPLRSIYYMIKVSLAIIFLRLSYKGGENR